MPLMLRTPVSQAVCTLPTPPVPTSLRGPWETAQQAPAVVESRLELVVVLLVDLVREALLVAMVDLADVAAAVDAVVAADAVVDVEVEVVDVVEAVVKKRLDQNPAFSLSERCSLMQAPTSPFDLQPIVMYCTFNLGETSQRLVMIYDGSFPRYI